MRNTVDYLSRRRNFNDRDVLFRTIDHLHHLAVVEPYAVPGEPGRVGSDTHAVVVAHRLPQRVDVTEARETTPVLRSSVVVCVHVLSLDHDDGRELVLALVAKVRRGRNPTSANFATPGGRTGGRFFEGSLGHVARLDFNFEFNDVAVFNFGFYFCFHHGHGGLVFFDGLHVRVLVIVRADTVVSSLEDFLQYLRTIK
jgi:hypothetical protein